jgi:hypothetical protein
VATVPSIVLSSVILFPRLLTASLSRPEPHAGAVLIVRIYEPDAGGLQCEAPLLHRSLFGIAASQFKVAKWYSDYQSGSSLKATIRVRIHCSSALRWFPTCTSISRLRDPMPESFFKPTCPDYQRLVRLRARRTPNDSRRALAIHNSCGR